MRKFAVPVIMMYLVVLMTSCGRITTTFIPGTEVVPTQIVETSTAFPSPTPSPSPTVTLPQPKHEYVIYGIKKLTAPLGPDHTGYTKIFSYDMEQHDEKVIFSDETLPIIILNEYGGGEYAIYEIVIPSLTTGKLYARMMPRDQYISYDPPGSLYEISTDGTNNYRRGFDFDTPASFVISPDGMKIAYISNDSLLVRELDSGNEVNRIDLSEYRDNWLRSISWAPDNTTILLDVATGDVHVTSQEAYAKTGCYLVDIYKKTMNKLTDPIFQKSTELDPGYSTDPFSFTFFPNSNSLIGFTRMNSSVNLISVSQAGKILNEIPLENNQNVWNIKISPNEKYVAYQGEEGICIKNILDNLSETVCLPGTTGEGADPNIFLLGWLER
jgi:hypothetical protein